MLLFVEKWHTNLQVCHLWTPQICLAQKILHVMLIFVGSIQNMFFHFAATALIFPIPWLVNNPQVPALEVDGQRAG